MSSPDGGASASPPASLAGDPFRWLPATIVGAAPQTPTGRSIVLEVPGLRPARAGQHVDVRLTADDGYQAVRSYSLSDVSLSGVSLSDVRASAGGAGRAPQVELTVEELPDGEVSPYLVSAAEVGDPVEVRGPIGGWFVWPPTEFDPESAVHAVLPEPDGAPAPGRSPVQLIGGGSGIAPLVAMVRARAAGAAAADDAVLGDAAADSAAAAGAAGPAGAPPPMRLLCSVRTPADRWFETELTALAEESAGEVQVDWVFTREAPAGATRASGRITRDELVDLVLPASEHPLVYVCGTNSFVETVAGWLVDAGHDPTRVRTERFGGV
ncbi:FAD-binding oxidoreductase [Frigoribacterium sp. PvP032]|uniref:FAD-binding oxidoreductase n=1 Tax=Frigoribacterium sp. PvP032 TaxID=2806589 RepID=UPI001B79CE97|nr:FAD-binding oxidoreductase [Frigoribacterium sp. PvP032]MBP1189244.1 ferredoxin-NADP reductase [Frigoribacterium sp. PvP032]